MNDPAAPDIPRIQIIYPKCRACGHNAGKKTYTRVRKSRRIVGDTWTNYATCTRCGASVRVEHWPEWGE